MRSFACKADHMASTELMSAMRLKVPVHIGNGVFSQPCGNEIVWELVVSGRGHVVVGAGAGRCGGSLELDVGSP
jgi:hypothetical protein